MRPASLRLNVRVFTVFLVVGLLMLVAASYFVIGVGQAGLRNAGSEHLRQIADQTAAAVDTYVFRLVIDASVISHVPEVRQTAAAASQRPFDRTAAVAADQNWRRAGVSVPEKKAVVDSPVSAFLADTVRQNPIYRALWLTDRYGRVVAASAVTDGYLVDASPSWKEAFGDGGGGRLVVGDVRFDPGTRTYQMEISAPVEDQPGGQLTGVLQVVVDMREIGAVLGGVRMGATGDAVLLREDGSVVYALGSAGPQASFFATDLLREHLAAAKKARDQGQAAAALKFGATGPGGNPRLVGAALSQLKASFPHLDWVVAVSQAESELFAPVRSQFTALLVVIGLTVLAVLLFALWYSTTLAAPPEPEEMDMHLVQHPRLHRIAEPDEEAAGSVPAGEPEEPRSAGA
jgi:hypothetical protein